MPRGAGNLSSAARRLTASSDRTRDNDVLGSPVGTARRRARSAQAVLDDARGHGPGRTPHGPALADLAGEVGRTAACLLRARARGSEAARRRRSRTRGPTAAPRTGFDPSAGAVDTVHGSRDSAPPARAVRTEPAVSGGWRVCGAPAETTARERAVRTCWPRTDTSSRLPGPSADARVSCRSWWCRRPEPWWGGAARPSECRRARAASLPGGARAARRAGGHACFRASPVLGPGLWPSRRSRARAPRRWPRCPSTTTPPARKTSGAGGDASLEDRVPWLASGPWRLDIWPRTAAARTDRKARLACSVHRLHAGPRRRR